MQTGDVLNHYAVIEKIGAGGMGEVYHARDSKLGRDVALKILPPEFASNPDRLARFRREAKVLAQLNHPNIASIYGLEETPEAVFLVMELVEGDDLSEILRSGALPVEDATDIAKQIANGLEEAHENGIVHRDLKPANIKRTPEGRVKILDFGLAMALADQSSAEQESASSMLTLTAPMTEAGMVLGTAAYMSPEQARGHTVDRRTDIWAFGVILFEMLTGRRLFAGETVTDTLAGILKTDPDWDSLPPNLPHQVERVLRRCLVRKPRQRLRDIGEARVRLDDPDAESGLLTDRIRAVQESTPSRLRFLPWTLLVLALAGLAYVGFVAYGRGGSNSPIQVALPAPAGVEFELNTAYPAVPVISPDGQYVVFGGKGTENDEVRLYLRSLDSNEAVALDGTRNAQYPFWSPDSRWIAFFDRAEGLKKIPVDGGPDQTICEAGNAKGGSWSPDGTIVFAPDFNTSIMKVSALGGAPVPVTDVDQDEEFDSHRHPWFLPDGRRFLYLARSVGENGNEIRIASIDGDSSRVVMPSGAGVQYADGHLIYLRKNVLMAQVFDPDRVEFTSDPVPIASNVLMLNGAAKGVFSVAGNGSLVYLRGQDATMSASLDWVDRDGKKLEEIQDRDPFNTAVLSPDEKFIVLTVYDATRTNRDLWIYEVERGFKSRFTNEGSDERYPLWSPDGRRIYYVSDQDGYYKAYRKAVSGTESAEVVLDVGKSLRIWDLSMDERHVLYSTAGEESSTGDLWVADLGGEQEPRLLRSSDADDGAARFSPDGKWISYWSEESGTGQVYLAPWPGMEYTRRVSTTSGAWQFWSADSRELVFQDSESRLFSSTINPEGDGVRIGAPEPLFAARGMQYAGPLLDMTGDARRFIVVTTVDAAAPGFADLILNWLELLPDR